MSAAADELAERIRDLIGHRPGVTEKKMFGGVGFMLNGNMMVGAMRSGTLMMRVGPDLYKQALTHPGAMPMIHGGRPMTGFVDVADDGINDDGLKAAVRFCWQFAETLPAK